jgi:hypothetical protein
MQQARRDLWTPIAGLLAAVTFVVGLILVSNSPDDSDTDAQVLAWYTDHGHRVGNLIGAFMLAFCGLFVLWFVGGLRQRLRAAEGPGGRLANIALGGAAAFVSMLWIGASALGAVSAGQEFGSIPDLHTADVARYLGATGFVAILIFGAFGAIAMIDAASIVVMRTGILPKWFAWLGFVAAIVLLFGVIFLPMIALPIWLLAASYVLFKLPSIEAEPVVVVPAPPQG